MVSYDTSRQDSFCVNEALIFINLTAAELKRGVSATYSVHKLQSGCVKTALCVGRDATRWQQKCSSGLAKCLAGHQVENPLIHLLRVLTLGEEGVWRAAAWPF
jgi:hypothetical protein